MEEYQFIETCSNSCDHSNNYGLKIIHLLPMFVGYWGNEQLSNLLLITYLLLFKFVKHWLENLLGLVGNIQRIGKIFMGWL
jgi:hypothetical protein